MEYKFCTDYKTEDYILKTSWEDLPKEVQERAVVCGVDLMMALLIGSKGKQFQAGLAMAKAHYKDGKVPVVGDESRFDILGAAVAMSHASNSFDIDDGHNMIKGHPGTSFVGGVLAAALDRGVTWKEYLTTLVVCYETAIRCGLALQDHYQYLHSTGTYGAFGTAACMGRILGFNREQLGNALSMAEFHAPMTPVMRSVQYPSMNKDGVPFGVLVGAEAALETMAGSTARGHILELPEYRDLVDSLGSRYEIMNLYFKPYTCCRWAHQPITACIDLKNEYQFEASDVEWVKVHTFDSAAQLSKIVPETADEAQYNIAWPVASSLVFGDVGLNQVIESGLGNPEVIHMMERLSFDVDPEMEKEFPAKRLAWVEIALKDSRMLRSKVYAAPGEHTDHVDLTWIKKKFMRITSSILDEKKQESILELLCEDKYREENVRAIIEKINGELLL